jgi:hypothetical protein
MFEVSHGQVDSSQTSVDTTASGEPDRTVDVQRGAEQLALLLRLGLLLEEPLAKVVQALTGTGRELLELCDDRANWC